MADFLSFEGPGWRGEGGLEMVEKIAMVGKEVVVGKGWAGRR